MKKETFKLVKMGYDARQYAAHVMEGKEFIHHGDTVYSFKHVPDYEEFCKFMRYGTTTFGEEMVFSNNHEWELVEPEKTTVEYGDVIHLKNIRVYHFITEDRAGVPLSTAEEIITDLDEIRLGLRPRDLEKWAKYSADKGIKFGKDW